MKIFSTSLTEFCLVTILAGWLGGVAQAQSMDYFGGINQDGSGEITLEVESAPAKDLPVDMITFDPLKVTIAGAEIGNTLPDLRNKDLVQQREVNENGHVMQGAALNVSMTIRGPVKKNWQRFALLFSSKSDPENKLSEDVVYALRSEDELALVWKTATLEDYVSYSVVRRSVRFKRSDNGDGTSVFTGSFHLQTANLKPGEYQIYARVYRSIGEEIVEKDVQQFKFTVVDAPLSLVADLPSSVPTFDGDKSAQNVRYSVMLSDWAVPPIRAEMETKTPGITLDYGDMTSELDGNMFDVLLMPTKANVGDNARLTLRVQDGLGRTASLSRRLAITDGEKGEIQVDMPSMVDAGDTIYGTVTYPEGFTLVTPPRIADRNGFEWTSSDYTSFQISVQEEGVHHRRLFAIVARGHVAGVDYEPVLTWKREYDVVSQDLIFDPVARQEARNKRKADADDRRRAFWKIMIGDGANETDHSTGGSSEGTFEIVSTETFENTSGGLSSNRASSPNDTSYIGRGGPPLGDNTTSVCGTAIDGYSFSAGISNSGWVIYGNGEDGVSEGERYFRTIRLIQLGMPYNYDKQYNFLSYYEEDCVLESEKIAQSDGTINENLYYSNGGRKSVFTASHQMEWDRAGNVTYNSSQ